MVPIRFLGKFGAYNAGEVAGFEASMAKGLVGDGVAEYAAPPDPSPVSLPSLPVGALSRDQLESMTLAQLRTLAGERGVPVSLRTPKDAVIDAILAAAS